jgi:glycosyltransferase involved in cell wall biosynthesis
VVFDGTMDFRPNVDAVLWFSNEVWPTVHAERPNARFYIVGRNPVPEVAALADIPGVVVTGAVEDTRTWVAGATVYVVPMRMGGGVRLKVLQAMAMGCAMVSTSMGSEGIDVRPGKDMLMSFSPQGFAQAVLLLLSDSRRRRALGASARELVTSRYAWEHLLPLLDDIYPPQ